MSREDQVFERTINDVVFDYAGFLLRKKLISSDDYQHFTSPKGSIELLDVLLDKVYEVEEFEGRLIPTVEAFQHYCVFVIKTYGGRKVWNRFVKDLFEEKRKNTDFSFMASRGLGKSFFLYVLYTSFKMFTNSGYKLTFFANVPIQLVENLRLLRTLIDNNEVLYSKKAVEKGKDLKWTERQIEYNGGMLYSISAGTSPRFMHVHEVIIDDIRTETSKQTDAELIDYTLSQIFPIAQRNDGPITISGTPIHLKDYYHFFMGSLREWKGQLIINGEKSHLGFVSKVWKAELEDGTPYLPEVYNKAKLERTKNKIGDIRFQREYMLNCIDESLNIFSESLLTSCYHPEYKYLFAPENNDSQFVIGVDVATSGAASADYSAFIVLENLRTDSGSKRIVRHIVHEKGMEISEQIDTIQSLSLKFNNAIVVVEKNNVGVALIQDLIKRNVNVEEFVTTRDKKEGMIRYLVNEMKNGNFYFPEETLEITNLRKEMLNFGIKITRAGNERMEALSGHDDLVMALGMAVLKTQDLGGYAFAIAQD